MKFGWKDVWATVFFAAIVVPYGFYLALGGITFIQDSNGGTAFGILDPTGMSAVGLVLGAIAAIVGGWIVLSEGNVVAYLTGGLGLVSLVLGLLALVGENLFNNATVWESVLGAFIASVVLLWGIAIVRHSGLIGGGQTQASASMTSA